MYDEFVEYMRYVAKKLGKSHSCTRAEAAAVLNECADKVEKIEKNYLDCRNELCLKCGKYIERYKGACADCRWKV